MDGPLNPYDVILADCPWGYEDTCDAGERGAAHKYPVMTTEALCALPVSRLAAEDAVLFQWATFPMIADALKVIEAWGFRYTTVGFVWVKTAPGSALQRARTALTQALPTVLHHARVARQDSVKLHRLIRAEAKQAQGLGDALALAKLVSASLAEVRTVRVARELMATLSDAGVLDQGLRWGMGNYTRSNPEVCLLATRGDLPRASAGVHSVVLAPSTVHSAKPPEVHRRIVQLLGDRRRIELFARVRTPGFHAWGNEVPGGNDVDLLNLPIMGQLPLLT